MSKILIERSAAEQALRALESCGAGHISDGGNQWYDEKQVDKAIVALQKALAEQPQQEPAPASLWLYWKVDNKSVVTGPFKTSAKDEAYGLDCIDQTPLTVAAPQPAQRKPLTQEEVVEGFCKQPHDVQFVSVFNAGVRFAEAAHGIKE